MLLVKKKLCPSDTFTFIFEFPDDTDNITYTTDEVTEETVKGFV